MVNAMTSHFPKIVSSGMKIKLSVLDANKIISSTLSPETVSFKFKIVKNTVPSVTVSFVTKIINFLG